MQFKASGLGGIAMRTPNGFEVSTSADQTTFVWHPARVIGIEHATNTVSLDVSGISRPAHLSSVRYLWSNTPCTHPRWAIGNCSIYARVEGLPAAPFTGAIDEQTLR